MIHQIDLVLAANKASNDGTNMPKMSNTTLHPNKKHHTMPTPHIAPKSRHVDHKTKKQVSNESLKQTLKPAAEQSLNDGMHHLGQCFQMSQHSSIMEAIPHTPLHEEYGHSIDSNARQGAIPSKQSTQAAAYFC